MHVASGSERENKYCADILSFFFFLLIIKVFVWRRNLYKKKKKTRISIHNYCVSFNIPNLSFSNATNVWAVGKDSMGSRG